MRKSMLHGELREMSMLKQWSLEFLEHQELEVLWEQLPASSKHAVTQHYARLMARTLVQRIRALKKTPEARDEPHRHD